MSHFTNPTFRVGPMDSGSSMHLNTDGASQRRVSILGGSRNMREEMEIKKRMKSRRTMEGEHVDLQSARFAEHGISLGTGKSRRKEDKKEKEEEDRYYVDFIRSKFSCKECKYFKPKVARGAAKPSGKNPQCECGDFEKDHYRPTQETRRQETKPQDFSVKWNPMEHIHELHPTNAFGQIEFINEGLAGQQPTEYIRISDGNRIEDVLELMTDMWGLDQPEKPSLCISVIGGAKNFKLEGRKKEVFHHGLIKAAQTTNAWLITSGLNLGIIRVVGDALQQGQTFHWGKRRIAQRLRCIGIAPWGYVLNRDRLVSQDCRGLFPATYKISNVIKSGSPVSLNPNHTHYIFVDDGYRRRYGGSKSAEFRASLEMKIAQSDEEGGLGIPVVLLIVEGGYDVFIDASNSIRQRVPVVVCDGTGRAADIIAFAAKKAKIGEVNAETGLRSLRNNHVEELNARIQEKFGSEFKPGTDKQLDKAFTMVADIVADEKLITVFDMNRSNDLDLSILYALLKVQGGKSEDTFMQQLSLALTWNRVDIASDKIFSDDFAWSESNPGLLDQLVLSALVDDKIEFVKLFLQNGVVMKEFLTVKRLRDLYNEGTTKDSHFRMVLHRNVPYCTTSSYIHLSHVRYLLRKLVQKYHNDIYDLDNPEVANSLSIEAKVTMEEVEKMQFPHPFNELFIWAVLTRRPTMARYFWELTDEAIPQAIAASRVYRALSKALPSYDTENKEIYIRWKDDFEMLAVKVVEECQEIDPAKASLLVEKRHNTWGGYNCLEMASAAVDRKFLSTVVCQNSVNFIWDQGVNASIPAVVLCILIPPFIFWQRLVRFQIPTMSENSCTAGCKKLLNFYRAPKTKFAVNAIFSGLFLLFYAYFLLFGFQKKIETTEWVVIFFIVVLVVEETREMFASKSDTVLEKLNDWWHFSVWNRLDLLMVILAIVSVMLRIGGEKYYSETKTLYVVTGCFFFLRVFRLYSVSPILGPKLVMIKRMVVELLLYLAILIVALLTYGVSSQALLYPIRPFSKEAIIGVFYYPYWQIYGEIYLEEADAEKPGCNGNNTHTSAGELCPTKNGLVFVLLAIYLIIANVLLLNLLIAIFSNVFTQVQENSLEIWKFEMYFLVVEYEQKPYLPIPFVIIEDFIRFIVFIVRSCRARFSPPEPPDFSEDDDHIDLLSFSYNSVKTFITNLKAERRQAVSHRLDVIEKRMEELYRLVEDERQLENFYHHHHHHRQLSLNDPARPPTRGESVMEPHPLPPPPSMLKEEPKADGEASNQWPDANLVNDTQPRKQLEQSKYSPKEKAADAQVEIVRDQRRRDEQAQQFEMDMLPSSPTPDSRRGPLIRNSTADSGSTNDLDQAILRNDLSDDRSVLQRLQSFEERTEAMLDNLRTQVGSQQRKKEKIGALKRRLANLEANTGRSLSTIEELLRNIVSRPESRPRRSQRAALLNLEEEDESEEEMPRAGARRKP